MPGAVDLEREVELMLKEVRHRPPRIVVDKINIGIAPQLYNWSVMTEWAPGGRLSLLADVWIDFPGRGDICV